MDWIAGSRKVLFLEHFDVLGRDLTVQDSKSRNWKLIEERCLDQGALSTNSDRNP